MATFGVGQNDILSHLTIHGFSGQMKDWEPFKAWFLASAINKKHSDILTGKLVMPKVKCDANTGDAVAFSDEEMKAFELGAKAHNDLLLKNEAVQDFHWKCCFCHFEIAQGLERKV